MRLKRVCKNNHLFKNRRYWYHVSSTLNGKEEHLIPWGTRKGFNRSDSEPDGNRICVSPSIEQCLTAVPYRLSSEFVIYRTKTKVKANKPTDVFDMNVTNEGWLQEPTTFVKVGVLNFEDVERGLKVDKVISEAASAGMPTYSGRVLRWWKKARIKRFIKSP